MERDRGKGANVWEECEKEQEKRECETARQGVKERMRAKCVRGRPKKRLRNGVTKWRKRMTT